MSSPLVLGPLQRRKKVAVCPLLLSWGHFKGIKKLPYVLYTCMGLGLEATNSMEFHCYFGFHLIENGC
jgi:hypothetical protein